MTKEQAIEVLRCRTNLGYGIVIENESTQVIDEALDLAIKTLEQQPSDDCVSRQAVKDIIHEYKNNIDSQLSWLSDGVCDLPPVTPTQRWIPVSEKLPEEETTVLICTDQGDIDASRIFSYSDGTWKWFASSWCYGEIIAWMPLPEPYIESEGE